MKKSYIVTIALAGFAILFIVISAVITAIGAPWVNNTGDAIALWFVDTLRILGGVLFIISFIIGFMTYRDGKK